MDHGIWFDMLHDYILAIFNYFNFLFFYAGLTLCPVKSFKLYITRIDPVFPNLWQQPKLSVTWDDAFWYNRSPLSKNKIGNLMTKLTREAKLSRSYTNHCVRSTCITILDRAGHEARHIMSVSGHKKIESIQNYTYRTSEAQKRKMSESLATAIVSTPPKKSKHEVSATESVPPANSKGNTVQIAQEKNQFGTIDQVHLKDLLQITPEEENNLMRELFDVPFEPNVTNVVSNVQEHKPNLASVAPKMVFENSNITINFNVTR